MSVLAGGSALGQVIAVLASPVLTRLYGPADFGTLAVYTALISLIGALAALSYHQAIPLPEDDAEAANLLGVSMLSALVVAGLTGLAVVFGGERLALLLDAPALVPWLWMIPLGIVGLGAYEVITQWAVRKKRFSAIARTAIARSVAQTGTHLGLGFGGLAPFGLLLGQLVGQWTGSGSLLQISYRNDREALGAITLARMRAAAHRYRRFPQFTTPAVILNAASVQAPPLLLSYFFGGAVTGFFALGARILLMPVHLIAKSASQVFFASAAEANREGRLAHETMRLFSQMVRIAAPFALLIGIVAPDLFSAVFGGAWYEAGVYTRWLTPWLLLVFVTFPLTPLISVLERQRAGLLVQVVLLVARVGGLVVGGLLGDPLLAIALFGLGSALCWLGYLLWLIQASGATLQLAFHAAGRPMAEALTWCIPLLLANAAGLDEGIVLAAFVVTSALLLLRLMRA